MVIVPLTERSRCGRFTLVDAADIGWVSRQLWPYRVRPRGRGPSRWVIGYAGRCGDTLHRAVVSQDRTVPAAQAILHQNGWGLDNRRANLIVAHTGQHKRARNIHRSKKGWQVQIGQRIIGRYPTEDEAVVAHEKAARDAGYLTPAMQAEYLQPVLQQLEAWVNEGVLIRHIPNAPLVEDRYRLKI